VREAVYGMVIKSANDAAEAMGDHLGGSEDKFAAAMTRKARSLGMKNTVFRNASGLPDKRQVTTARDMAILGLALVNRYPREYAIFSQRSFNFRGRTVSGHNNLMYRYRGMDGIKTGYTDASGFNLVSAVNDNGRRVIGVVLGGKTARSRDDRMAALLNDAMPDASTGKGSQMVASAASVATVATVAKKPARRQPPASIPAPAVPPHADAIALEIAAADENMADMLQASVTAPASSAAKTKGGWHVQIAATDSPAAAAALLSKAQRGLNGQFAGISPYTEAVPSGSSTLYRARFAGFNSQALAQSACKQLKAHAYHCMVIGKNG
jgi:D-alanyl-D-alanine carboxypeptidase (penicillin-binding protein 5/6)